MGVIDPSGLDRPRPESAKPQAARPQQTPAPAATPSPTSVPPSATMPPDLRALAARLKGRIPTPENRVVAIPASEAFPIFAQIEEERARAALGVLHPGQLITGKGIFMGLWAARDEKGNFLGHQFNLFAAPEDLKDASGNNLLLNFKEAVKELASRKNWHGHDGGNFENDTAFYAALTNSVGIGQWFIPPSKLLYGNNADGIACWGNNMYALRNTRDFKKPKHAFTITDSGSNNAHCYWSSTERDQSLYGMYIADFTNGNGGWGDKDGSHFSCRPCRVELAF